MSEQEGVIKYQLHHTQQAVSPSPLLTEINAWRSIFCQLQMMGQDQARYDAYGFGNISQRDDTKGFVITGTQTGHLSTLTVDDFAWVHSENLATNEIHSQGFCQPSSEALTHASVYTKNKTIHAVVHVHCPEIWKHTHTLKLAYTAQNIAYGTPEMAQAVMDLVQKNQGIFTMLGHEDGVIAFGKTLAQASDILIRQFANALTIEMRDRYG
ncbi:MAG: class II aldolase/adducin family protein [Methylococcales bacterium]|nr:class II aldolase/adducin family protein [Methylococcales bacterium]